MWHMGIFPTWEWSFDLTSLSGYCVGLSIILWEEQKEKKKTLSGERGRGEKKKKNRPLRDNEPTPPPCATTTAKDKRERVKWLAQVQCTDGAQVEV